MTPVQVLFITLALLALSMACAIIVSLFVRVKTYLRVERVVSKACDLVAGALEFEGAPPGATETQWKTFKVDFRQLLGAVKGK